MTADDLQPGVHRSGGDTVFAVTARDAQSVTLCLFDGARETRLAMARQGELHVAAVPNVRAGQAYGYRAAGPWAPDQGMLYDDSKLLVDPYAVALDRRFVFDPRLAARGVNTAALVPRALVRDLTPVTPSPPLLRNGGLIYEVNVRALTMRHPDVPPFLRGTIAALAHPAILAHLKQLHVDAVELMPVVAWIDERHLPERGLHNGWGYNPVVPMALDPGLAPGGVAELRDTVAALHRAGIAVILDIVLNHTGESDALGPTLSLRGLDGRYYARGPDGALINDTGTGNTLDAAQPLVRRLMRDSLRHFVRHCGVDGFRFDLGTVLARGPGFDAQAPIFAEIAADPLLADRVMIAEPWDIGPGGYQLGHFPDGWLEWNDRYRDDVRRFWRGDAGMLGALATRLMGSSDIFSGPISRSVNFLAAHDGFTLADLVAYRARHNQANGEDNRDGHGENFSWNHGVEGPSDDPAIRATRGADVRALLATLFATRGTILLKAGDEFGHSQQGNNNAYAQDNAITWLDWDMRDRDLEAYVARLSAARHHNQAAFAPDFLAEADWRGLDGAPMTPGRWGDAEGFIVTLPSGTTIRIDRSQRAVTVTSKTR